MTVTSPPLPPGYTLKSGLPSIPEYLHLRAASGLTPHSVEQARPIAAGSWYSCSIQWTDPGTSSAETSPVTVAMGRIIGDGGWYFHIADMATLPEHQGKGLGKAVLRELLAYIRIHAPVGEGSEPYVSLLADEPGRALYEKHGFEYTGPRTQGMALKKGWWADP